MFGILILVILALYLAFLYPLFRRKTTEAPRSARYDMQMKKLWSAAQDSMRDHKPLRAEKALLTILKFDEKNAAAYNRLGILYAKEQKFDEAIECFEIAQSLDNNPSSLHNVGLIYLETGAFEKAAMAFEQAIELENTVPARYIALAKAREKLGQTKAAVDALESAYALDHSTSTLRQILAIYELSGDAEALADITARIEAQIAESNARTSSRTSRRPARAPRPAKPPRVAKPARPAPKPSAPVASARPSNTHLVRRPAARTPQRPTPARPLPQTAPRRVNHLPGSRKKQI